MQEALDINDPIRFIQIREIIQSKLSLRRFYQRTYEWFRDRTLHLPKNSPIVEIGSGAGYLKEYLPNALTTDIIPYPNLDKVFDCRQMPFADHSVAAFCLFNAFHHIPDVTLFLSECNRCLKDDGVLLISDQHVGLISYLVLKYFHSEGFDHQRQDWDFESSGPLSGSNGALSWMVFKRDREIFQAKFPDLELVSYTTHSPLLYWLSGGLKSWNLAPGMLIPVIEFAEKCLLKISFHFGCFNFILLKKRSHNL